VSAAAVAEARDMADEDLVGAERVPLGASGGRLRHPFTFGADEVTLHRRQGSYGRRQCLWLPFAGMGAPSPAGWYPDPEAFGQRFFDGQRWTSHCSPAASGWYPDPAGGGQRYWNGSYWSAGNPAAPKAELSRKHRKWVIGGVIAVVIAFVVAVGVGMVLDSRPVRSVHSDDPAIEAFYRDLEAAGFGEMSVGDAEDNAKVACEGYALVLWGEADYSMADSFRFSAAAMQACKALRE
jgi:Protein of unknown function (DUF2510)